MDDLETRLVTALRGPLGDDEPPPDLAGRIHRAVASRRARRRNAWLATAAGALVVGVSVPAVLRAGLPGTTSARVEPTRVAEPGAVRVPLGTGTPSATVTLPARPTASGTVRAGAELAAVVDVNRSRVVPGRTPDGQEFRPEALSADGRVLGMTPDHRVWEDGVRDLGVSAVAGLGAQPGIRTWTRQYGKAADQLCRGSDGVDRVVSPQGTDPRSPVWVDHGVIVGSDVMRQPWVAKGCSEPGKVVDLLLSGDAVTFAYPTLYVVDASNEKKLLEIDVEAWKIVARHPLPKGVQVHTMDMPDQVWCGAASRTHFAWAAGSTLFYAARGSMDRVLGKYPVPPPYTGTRARMTAGARLVAYTTGRQSVVLDTRTGATYWLPGIAYAAGDLLLWQDGASYRIGRTR